MNTEPWRGWAGVLGALVVAAAALVRPSPAAAQSGPLIAELIEYREVRSVIPPGTAERFARVCGVSPAAAAAAKDLVAAARDDLARAINRHLRTVRDDPTFEDLLASERRVVEDAAGVERRMLADLRAVLPADEGRGGEGKGAVVGGGGGGGAPCFERFARAHRRTLLRLSPAFGLPADLDGLFAEAGFDPASDPALAGILARADVETDAALVRQRRAVLAYFASVRGRADATEDGARRRDAASKEFQLAGDGLTRALARPVEGVLARVPDAVRDRLVVEVLRGQLGAFDPNILEPERYPVAREVARLELTPEQRAAAERALAEARAEMLALARRTVLEQSAYLTADAAAQARYRTAPTNVLLGDASKVRARTSAALLALLTPEQRSEYEASPVVEPSASSVVEEERR